MARGSFFLCAESRYSGAMLSRAATVILRLTMASVPLALGACAAVGPASTTEAVPSDFAVSVSITNSTEGFEPAWYVLEADGTLRAALGAPSPQSPIPPRVRTLTPGARAQVWRAVQDAAWIPEADTPAAVNATDDATPAVELAEVYVAANGGRWSGRVVEPPKSPGSERLQGVIRELRRLAWLPTSR